MKNNRFHKTTDFQKQHILERNLKAATNLIRKQTLKDNRSQNKFRKNNKYQIATNLKKQHILVLFLMVTKDGTKF